MYSQVYSKMNYSQMHNNKYSKMRTKVVGKVHIKVHSKVHLKVVGKVHVKVHTNEPVLALECRDHLEGGHLICGFLDININININITCVILQKHQNYHQHFERKFPF